MYSCIKRFIAAFIAASFVFASGSNIYAQTVSMKLFYDGKSHNYSAEEVKIQVDGEGITGLDVPPIIINDRTMVPARAVFEKLGCDIAWNEEMQEVYVMHNTDLVILKIDSQTGTKNGESFTMDTPAKIVNDRTLIPIRAVSEAIGCDVKWDDGTRTVIVSSVKETAPPDSNSENNGGGQSSGEGNGTILDPEEGNSSSSGSSSSGGSNTNSNTNVSSKTIGITGISVPESIASEQKFYIRADGEIANYSSFILENNRLVVDITNADMKVSNTEIKNTNSSVVTSVRSAQNQTQPVKIARVVFDLSSLGDYEVKLSDDKKSIAVSFGISQVSNINTSSRGGADYINIYGDTSLSAEAYVEANPNRVVIDIHNAVSLLNSDYDASGLNFAQNIKTSQPDAKTVRITVDVSRTVEAEVINNGGYTSVCITRSTLDNVSYNSVSHTLTLLNAEELDDRGISHTDNYMGKTYRLTLNGDYSELYGTGTIKCNDDYLSTIKVGLDNNGNTYFEAAENRIVAVKTSDFSSTIEIKFVNPKEVYNKISPYLPEEEAKWLEKVTREI